MPRIGLDDSGSSPGNEHLGRQQRDHRIDALHGERVIARPQRLSVATGHGAKGFFVIGSGVVAEKHSHAAHHGPPRSATGRSSRAASWESYEVGTSWCRLEVEATDDRTLLNGVVGPRRFADLAALLTRFGLEFGIELYDDDGALLREIQAGTPPVPLKEAPPRLPGRLLGRLLGRLGLAPARR
ncbi:hypothetical protein [Streptomyces lavendulae]|uniref:hypothetical protein n=1 Tax=Streptomyces lavendulae TaxID=1914 RepID=UPI002552FBBA|nr:hypothetical protein [Streptomyces lavendulae]